MLSLLAAGVSMHGQAPSVTWKGFSGSKIGGFALSVATPKPQNFTGTPTYKYYQRFKALTDDGGSAGATMKPTGQSDEEVVVRDGTLYYPPTKAGTYYYVVKATSGSQTAECEAELTVTDWAGTPGMVDQKIEMQNEQKDPAQTQKVFNKQECTFAEGKQWECAGIYKCPDPKSAGTWSARDYVTLILDAPVYAQLLVTYCDTEGNELGSATSTPCYSPVHDFKLTVNHPSRGVVVKSVNLQLARNYGAQLKVTALAFYGVKYTSAADLREPGNLIDLQDDFTDPTLDKKWTYWHDTKGITNRSWPEVSDGALKFDILEANEDDYKSMLIFTPDAMLSAGEEYEVTAKAWASTPTSILLKYEDSSTGKQGGYKQWDLTSEPKPFTSYLTPDDNANTIRWQLAKAVSTIHFDDFSIKNRYPGGRIADPKELYGNKNWEGVPLGAYGIAFNGSAGTWKNETKVEWKKDTKTILYKEPNAMCGHWFGTGEKAGEDPVDWLQWSKLTVVLDKAFTGSLTISYLDGSNDVVNVTDKSTIEVPITKASAVTQYYLTIKSLKTANGDPYVVKSVYLTPATAADTKGGQQMFAYSYTATERLFVNHYFNLVNSGTGAEKAQMNVFTVGGRTDDKHPDAGCLGLLNPHAEYVNDDNKGYHACQLGLDLPFVLTSTKDYTLKFWAKRISSDEYARLREQTQAAAEEGNKGLTLSNSSSDEAAATLKAAELSEDLECMWQNHDGAKKADGKDLQGGYTPVKVGDDWTECTYTIRIDVPYDKKQWPSNSTRLIIGFGRTEGAWLIDDLSLAGTTGTKTKSTVRLHWYLPEEQKSLPGGLAPDWSKLLCATAAAYPRAGVSPVTYSYTDPETGKLAALTDKSTYQLPNVTEDTKFVVTANSNGNSQYYKALPVEMEFWITKDGERHEGGALSVVEGSGKAVVATQWYTLGGQTLAGPSRGLCVVREQHADGSTSARLVRVRE